MDLKQKCINDHIPIIRDQTLTLISKIVEINKYSSILEIGSAYGYSADCFSKFPTITHITSIEKNIDNYNIAISLNNPKINFVNADAFEYQTTNKFDLIFIDGPKSHQEKLFDKYSNNLNQNGIIVIDNIFLKKFNDRENLTKNQINLINKVNAFKQWLLNKKDWRVKIIDIDDGVALCYRSNNIKV